MKFQNDCYLICWISCIKTLSNSIRSSIKLKKLIFEFSIVILQFADWYFLMLDLVYFLYVYFINYIKQFVFEIYVLIISSIAKLEASLRFDVLYFNWELLKSLLLLSIGIKCYDTNLLALNGPWKRRIFCFNSTKSFFTTEMKESKCFNFLNKYKYLYHFKNKMKYFKFSWEYKIITYILYTTCISNNKNNFIVT